MADSESTQESKKPLASESQGAAAVGTTSSDRPTLPLPRIEVPAGSEYAMDLNSPPRDFSAVQTHENTEEQGSEPINGEQGGIPLSNMSGTQGAATAANANSQQSASSDTNPATHVQTSGGGSGGDASHDGPSSPITTAPGAGTATAPALPQDETQQPPDIGPARSGLNDESSDSGGGDPAIYTTLCIANTENRHRWKITADYLRRRNETIPKRTSAAAPAGDELLDVTVGTIKRLLIADWRTDWETRPTDPSQIRLISMGEALTDDRALRDHRFKVDGPPRPILLSVRRPAEDDHDAEGDMPGKNAGSTRGADGEPRRGACGCCTVM